MKLITATEGITRPIEAAGSIEIKEQLDTNDLMSIALVCHKGQRFLD